MPERPASVPAEAVWEAGVDALFRSAAPTTELFAAGPMPDSVWRYERDMVNGQAVSVRWYDREGNQVTAAGQPLPERPRTVPGTAVYWARAQWWADGLADVDGKAHGRWHRWTRDGTPAGPYIFSLTPAQEALLPEIRAEWIARGLSCEPADRPAAEAGVRAAYQAAGLGPPPRLVWLGSPMGGALGRAILARTGGGEQVRDQVWSRPWDHAWSIHVRQPPVSNEVSRQVQNQVRDHVQAQVWDEIWAWSPSRGRWPSAGRPDGGGPAAASRSSATGPSSSAATGRAASTAATGPPSATATAGACGAGTAPGSPATSSRGSRGTWTEKISA